VPWSQFAPAAFLFILPIAHTTPARIACLVLSVITVIASHRRRTPSRRPPLYLALAICGWLGVCLVATFASIEPAYSWGEFRNEVLSTLAAFGVFYAATDNEAVLRRWRTVLLASFATVATVAAVSYLVGVNWSREGFVGDRNAYSTYIVLIVPFLCLQWLETGGHRPVRRIAIGVLIAAALVTGAFTQNRNMWFAIAIEFVVFTVLVWRHLAPTDRQRLRARAVATGLVGLLVLVCALAYVVQQKAVVSHTSTEEQARFDRDPRFEIWVYAAERFRERPWSGYGFGRGILRGDFRTHFDNPLKWHGHNVVVDYALEAGAAGALVIVLLFTALMARAIQIDRNDRPGVWPAGAWAITMLVGIAFKVMTDDILVRESSLLFWSVLGMTFGLASRTLTNTTVAIPAVPDPSPSAAASSV
jgi:O-antigen ligase